MPDVRDIPATPEVAQAMAERMIELNEAVPAKPKRNRKPAPKKEINYKVEYKKLEAMLKEAEEAKNLAENKAELYFKKYREAEIKSEVAREKFAASVYHLKTGVMSAIGAFDQATK